MATEILDESFRSAATAARAYFTGRVKGTRETASGFGKFAGISVSVTLPVAAHSVPRRKVTLKPTHSKEGR